MHKEQRNNPNSDKTGLISLFLRNAERITDIDKRLKNPTHPFYDSTNFPDDAVYGQIVVDKDDPSTLWVYGRDDVWHKVGGAATAVLKYFTINIDVSVLWAIGPYSGLSDKAIDWVTDQGAGSFGTWSTNDTPDGSVLTHFVDVSHTTGDIFDYDTVDSTIVKTHGPGSFAAYASVDLRQDSAYDPINIVNKWHVIGIENLHLMQPPQKRDTLDKDTYGRDGKIDISQNVLIPAGEGASLWALRYGHNIPGNMKFKARFSIMWNGSFQ